MRATGIVRRLDDLGRWAIPKEIRRVLGWKEGDPIELYFDSENKTIVWKKKNEKISGACRIQWF